MAKHLSDEKMNSNYILWTKKLEQYGCSSEKMLSEIGQQIRVASFSMNESSGSSYEGALLDVVLNNLCVIGSHLCNAMNGNAEGKFSHPQLQVSKDSLMRVLLLQHIAKFEMFTPETNDWKIKNGYYYKFNDELAATLKLGERSLFLCMKYGIVLSEEEYEAMRIIDKDDEKMTQFTSPLSLIVKTANAMTAVECYRKTNQN